MIIKRDEYIEQLLSKRWNGKVKIITGIRRSGTYAQKDRTHLYSPQPKPHHGIHEHHLAVLHFDNLLAD
jgi:hypothetical protein